MLVVVVSVAVVVLVVVMVVVVVVLVLVIVVAMVVVATVTVLVLVVPLVLGGSSVTSQNQRFKKSTVINGFFVGCFHNLRFTVYSSQHFQILAPFDELFGFFLGLQTSKGFGLDDFLVSRFQPLLPPCIQGTAARPAAMAAAKSASSMLMPRLPPAFRATRAAAWISGAMENHHSL